MTVSVLFESQREQFVDENGHPIVNGKVYIGEPNQDPRTNPIVVYANRAKTVPLTQPIRTDAEGRTEDSVWIGETYSYAVDDENDVQQVTEPYIEVIDIPALIAEIIAEIIAVEGTGVKNLLPNGGMTVTLGTNVSLSGSFQEGLVSGAYGRATNASAGTLTGEVNDAYSSGRVCLYSDVSAPGAGDYIEHQERLYSGDAVRIRERSAVFSCYVEHNKTTAIDYTISVGICNALNNFASYTLVDTSDPVSVDPDTKTRLTFRIPDMGDTTNGVVMIVKAASGVIVLRDFKFGDQQIEVGDAVTDFVMLPYEPSRAAMIAQSMLLPTGFKAATGAPGAGGTNVSTQAYADASSSAAYSAAIAQARLYDGIRETLDTVTSTAGAIIPYDDTVPTVSEGTEIFSVSYTPTSASIDLAIDAFIPGTGNDNYARTAAVFVGSTCISAVSVYGASGVNIILACSGIYSPANTSPVTVSVRVGSAAAVDFYVNGGDNTGGRKNGGATKSTLTIREITRT